MYVIGCGTDNATCRGSKSGSLFLFADRSNGDWIQDYEIGGVSGRFRAYLPYGIAVVDRPVSHASYGGRTYICGWTTYNLVLDEHHRLWKQGIRGPEAAPTITGAVGTGAIGYLSWYDELTGERSPLSQGTVISTATPRTWTLPSRPPDDIFVSDGTVTGAATVVPDSEAAKTFYLRPGDRVGFPDLAANVSYSLVDTVLQSGEFTTDGTGLSVGSSTVVALPISRATHCELWLSVAGGLPRLVMRVPIGMTSVAESVATGDLGESFIGSFERFPRCALNAIWNDRQIMAGDPDNPDVVYMSELFFPERYAGLNFRTRDGAPVTGILALRDYCLIFSRDRTYMLQGYTENDFNFQMVDQSLGSVGHSCNAVVHGSAYVWTEKGPYMYNGSWHPLSPDNLFSPPVPYRTPAGNRSRAVVDPDANTFILVPDGIGLRDRYRGNYLGDSIFVFDYTTVQPETGGTFAPARLSIDSQAVTRRYVGSIYDRGYSYNYLSDKWGMGALYTLSYSEQRATDLSLSDQSFFVFAHGRINDTREFRLNLSTTFSPYITHPNFVVLLGHYYFDDPGGSVMEGKRFVKLWVDARTYSDSTVLSIYPGDDDAEELAGGTIVLDSGNFFPGTTGVFSFDVPKHLVATLLTGEGSVSPIWKVALDTITGRGISLRFDAPELARGGSFRGFGGEFIEGPASRYGIPIIPV